MKMGMVTYPPNPFPPSSEKVGDAVEIEKEITSLETELAEVKSGLTNVSGLLSNIKNLGVYTGDLNDIDETCFCFVGASASHAPVEHTDTHQLLTIVSETAYNGWKNTRVKIQIYMINSDIKKPYIRYFYGSGWYGWTSNN